jgi:hypothetical protein
VIGMIASALDCRSTIAMFASTCALVAVLAFAVPA